MENEQNEAETRELAAIQLLWKIFAHIQSFPTAMLVDLSSDELALFKSMIEALSDAEIEDDDE